MTRDQLDSVAFALVIARTSMKQMQAVLIALGCDDAAAQMAAHEANFETVSLMIQRGEIQAKETTQ